MAGNSRRRGAMRKPGTKKGMQVGSGGQRRRGLEGKGPTPRAEDRTGHPAARRAAAKRKETAAQSARRQRPEPGRPGATETVAGRNSVVEALRAEVPVKALYVAERIDSDDRVREVLRTAADRGLAVLEAPRSELDRVTGGAVHQGVALTLPPYDYAHPDDILTAAEEAGEVPLVVALDGVTDPRNLGAVVRSAAAFGAHGVVIPERRSAGMTAGAWKTSAGAAARVPVARATNLARQLRAYQEAGLFVIGLDGSGEVEVGEAAALGEPLCLVVGSEGAGMSRIVHQACDLVVRIPIARSVESLNAGVAAGVAMYEIARARR
ncbi:23S rRNA (guanosine(2251)-2'-O)-methyltransferase RlmB [Phytoactinopolyspora halotolerans]|uniref:23S rRNA (Guanosine(2251)-2'-O)-methyltransferase RlmB n=1 Tax=Phytoactinopolyspora halotolerans TaxID=1981512 RepID=A0A6L9S165_9ACTN|nr:23S rRNA (guanosine(2251)-2'-O)-methyltransferase RlmB [Phytoactinopolyspora halotolerans]NED98905.1 23S rRNA (guanosine(2251)-2'-O)-methyltransferase RlmB [Phytoactinopolyspora halotolerans]